MVYLYYFLAAVLVYFSFKSWRGGVAYLNYFRHELAKRPSEFTPFATVIAPCRGGEEGLAGNLAAVAAQNYPEYEIIFVVDDPEDPAVAVIDEIKPAFASAKLVIAPRARHSGQKVENLREAVVHADSRSEIFVFVDSDARPGLDWLSSLTAKLADPQIGAATGYRWFIPGNGGLAAEIRAAWNASIASALGPNTRSNFCWGGSTAIRRDVFDRLQVREKWQGTVSDDFTLTRVLAAAAMPIVFVPRALAASTGGCSWRELFEFTNRQMKITRVYASKLWVMSFIGSGLFTIVMSASAVIAALTPAATLTWAAALFTILAVAAFSIAKSWLRFTAVMLAIPESDESLRRQRPFQLTLWLLAQPLFFVNSAAALCSRRIRWRGTEYQMVSAEETRVL